MTAGGEREENGLLAYLIIRWARYAWMLAHDLVSESFLPVLI